MFHTIMYKNCPIHLRVMGGKEEVFYVPFGQHWMVPAKSVYAAKNKITRWLGRPRLNEEFKVSQP